MERKRLVLQHGSKKGLTRLMKSIQVKDIYGSNFVLHRPEPAFLTLSCSGIAWDQPVGSVPYVAHFKKKMREINLCIKLIELFQMTLKCSYLTVHFGKIYLQLTFFSEKFSDIKTFIMLCNHY